MAMKSVKRSTKTKVFANFAKHDNPSLCSPHFFSDIYALAVGVHLAIVHV
jgi:hypothetical protein